MAQDQKEETIVNVQEVYTKTEVFVDKNRKTLFIVLGAVGALFAGFFAYQYLIVKPKEAEAANALWRAQQWFEKDSLDMALNGNGEFEGFEAVANTYNGTKAGEMAQFYTGIIYRDKGDFQAALTNFQEADLDDETFSILALGNAGDCFVQLGNNEEGASYLEKAAKKAASSKGKDFLAPIYLLKASKVYIELGDKEKAKGLLTSATEGYDKKSQEYNEAAKLLAMLKAEE
ncbi:MAG: hypothetical protein RLZZ77_1265 [Bacteroidota bacterium]|jgi:tetratricopeptide (TPR) repeat protein